MGTEWRGMLAPLDVSTGDGRRFLSSGVSSRQSPLPLKWQRADTEGHDASVIVGSLERIEYGTVAEAIDSGWIDAKCIKPSKFADDLKAVWGSGQMFDDINPLEMPRLAEDVAEATTLLSRGVIGPSVDAGSAEAVIALKGSDEELTEEQFDEIFFGDEDSDAEFELLFTEYEIAAATLVSIPAFAECRPFQLLCPVGAVTASVRKTGWDDVPLAERDTAWDASAADKRVSDDSGIETDSPDWGRYSSAHLYQDDAADPETKGAYGFLIVDIVDGSPLIVPRGVFAVAGALQGARGGTTIPAADQTAMKDVVDTLYARMAEQFDDPSITPPWAQETASILTAVTAAASYDPDLFADPKLDKITPLTVTDDGRVYGHIATHDVCHAGMPGVCTTAPIDNTGYRMFHRYQPEGIPLPVGRITTGGGQHACSCRQCGGRNDDHACTKLAAGATISHYDRLSTIAWVRAGEDTRMNAVWVAGIANPNASVHDLAVLARQKVSGDWRPIGSELSLIDVLALAREEPGYPLPRFRMAAGRVFALTAAGVVSPARDEAPVGADIDYERLADLLVAGLASRLPVPAPPAPAESDAPAAGEAPDETTAVTDLMGEVEQAVHSGAAIQLRSELEKVR